MRWTLEELVERVARALADGDVRAPNGRVTGVPDVRMIRWYGTIGLVDRPSAMRGRTGLYGWRHLLQLVAIKRLQAQGQPLASIQAVLTGATNDELAAVAGLPVSESASVSPGLVQTDSVEEGPLPSTAPASDPTPGPAPRRFWTELPAPPAAPASPAHPEPMPVAPPSPAHPELMPVAPASPAHPEPMPVAPPPPTHPELMHAVRLGPAILLLPALPGPQDIAAIHAAAQPLLDLLTALTSKGEST